jgi:uncharacterized protein (TIGR00730 family)
VSRPIRRLCVFCGSSAGTRPEYATAAEGMGRLLARRGIALVYGGGRVGLMGITADAVLAAGGEVIGVIPEAMMAREVGHTGLTELHVVATMHERKALMYDLSDAFVALPGGYGTLDELCETLTWSQLGLHATPCGLLNVAGYFDALIRFFDHATDEGFVRPTHRGLATADADPETLLELLSAAPVTSQEKWLDASDR